MSLPRVKVKASQGTPSGTPCQPVDPWLQCVFCFRGLDCWALGLDLPVGPSALLRSVLPA